MSASAAWNDIDEASPLGRFVAAGLGRVEKQLGEAVTFPESFVSEAADHLRSAGGKRIRPLLTLTAAMVSGETPTDDVARRVETAASVVELTHLATLYHDDVMDSAPTRRGAPAAHEVWSNSVAILTGDVLFARASMLVAELGPEAVTLQAKTFERLCRGQLMETCGPTSDQDDIAFHLDVLAGKTGSLIATSARFGAWFAGSPAEHVDALTAFGERVGVAFQVADDVLDIASNEETSGKARGTDLREGVPTLPVLYARKDADAGDTAAKAVVEMLDGDLSDDAVLDKVASELAELPSTARAREFAKSLATEAVDCLSVLPESAAKGVLADMAGSLVDRMV